MSRRPPSARSGRPPSQRQLRVGEQMRHVLSEALTRDVVRDPDVAGRSITVTEVRISPDLGNATAYVVPLGTTMGGADADAVAAGLQRAAPFLRGLVGRQMQLRLREPRGVAATERSFGLPERPEHHRFSVLPRTKKWTTMNCRNISRTTRYLLRSHRWTCRKLRSR